MRPLTNGGGVGVVAYVDGEACCALSWLSRMSASSAHKMSDTCQQLHLIPRCFATHAYILRQALGWVGVWNVGGVGGVGWGGVGRGWAG